MISIAKALETVIQQTVPTTSSEILTILKANGAILFEDVISPIDMPPFRQAAMDGYAICIDDTLSYRIIDEVKAGDGHNPIIKKGETVRIFTGAAVPDSANAVVMQEKVTVNNGIASLSTAAKLNENIRPLAEQISKGQIAIKKGALLSPASIGFLASLGISEVKVYKMPSVAVVVTGSELAQAGEDLSFGKIYESNGVMLTSALDSLGHHKVTTFRIEDDYNSTINVLQTAISKYDVVLISGGISVGDYDFVSKALKELKVVELFYKVKQKPGKPLFFGKRDDKIIFALPGNPAAALSCFYIYVYPALQRISGNTTFAISKTKASCENDFIRKGDRPQFLKAIYSDGKVRILEGQSSAMLHTFALSNALIYVPETTETIKKNDEVEVILLPVN